MKLASDNDDLLAEINVTPLVDVMLVLLIIFMVTAPLIQQGIAVNLPKTEAAGPLGKDERDLILYITKNKRLRIDKYTVSMSTLQPKLNELLRNRKERKVFIKADSRVPYGFVIEVMGKVKLAGVDRIGMVTDLPKEKESSVTN